VVLREKKRKGGDDGGFDCGGLGGRCRGNVIGEWEKEKHTRLNPSLLTLIHDKLLQLLLVAVAQLAEVDVCADVVAEIHCDLCFLLSFRTIVCRRGRAGFLRDDGS